MTPPGATPQAPHTRVPNIVADCVRPLLAPAERDCLDYIIRHTIGFADGRGGRKARDTIAQSQFVNGQVAGGYLRDLGTGLTLNTVKKALAGLQEKELVEVSWSCTFCYWDPVPGEEGPAETDPNSRPQCPRCQRTLSVAWALAELTPRKIKHLLNTYDRQGRTFSYDADARRFRVDERPDEKAQRKQKEEDQREEALRIRQLLWYPEMVDEAVKRAEGQLKAGNKVSLTRRLSAFYRPVFKLQEDYPNAVLLKYALEETLKAPVLDEPRPWTWHRYARAICRRKKNSFEGRQHQEGTNAAAAAENSIEAREASMRDLLKQAQKLNLAGDTESARALLSDILAHSKDVAELFDGDIDACERALRLAFKQGQPFFVGVELDPYSPVDYYPEWSPPASDA